MSSGHNDEKTHAKILWTKYFTNEKFPNYGSFLVYARVYISFTALSFVRHVWSTLSLVISAFVDFKI